MIFGKWDAKAENDIKEKAMGIMHVNRLEPGMTLAEDVKDRIGRFLLGRGQKIEPGHLRILKIWGVAEVDVTGHVEVDEDTCADTQLDPEALARIEEELGSAFRHVELAHPAMEELFRLAVRDASDGGGREAPKGAASLRENVGKSVEEKAGEAPISFDARELLGGKAKLPELSSVAYELEEVIGWTRPLISTLAFHRGQPRLPPRLYTGYKLKRKEAGPMKNVTTIGIDLAKNVFQIHGVDGNGKVVLKKRLSRHNVLPFLANVGPCLLGLEACCGSHFWARELEKLGHEVRQMPPQYVKPYVKTNKNDANDAEAVCEAVSRPNMRFVPTKSQEQLNIQAIHRIRERLVRNRTSLTNQVRGLLLESGIAIPQGVAKIRKLLPEILEDLSNRLTLIERNYLSDLYAELVELDERILKQEKQLKALCEQSLECQRLLTIPGIGLLTATALVSAIGDAKTFRNGRQLAAWIGLTPRQHSSGGKDKLLGISKRGNSYLRKLLVHGARSVVYRCQNKEDDRSLWLAAIETRRGTMKATVAQANKTARIAWAVLVNGEGFKHAA